MFRLCALGSRNVKSKMKRTSRCCFWFRYYFTWDESILIVEWRGRMKRSVVEDLGIGYMVFREACWRRCLRVFLTFDLIFKFYNCMKDTAGVR